MDRTNPYEVAQAIGKLRAWRTAAAHNWALLPAGCGEPWLVTVFPGDAGNPARMLFFHGWREFHCYLISRQDGDFWVAASPEDITHLEAVFPQGAQPALFSCVEGYVRRVVDKESEPLLASMLYECFGLFMRFEGDPDLAMKFASERALFARRQDDDGKWSDCALPLPEKQPQFVEQVSLRKDILARAKDLPFDASWKLELDFGRLPNVQTNEPHPRAIYLFAAVNQSGGSRFAWRTMAVSGRPDGLVALWQTLAPQLLDHIVAAGKVPGEIHVRSMRMVRFLRPLGMHLPFKLVVNAELPALDNEVRSSLREKRI